MKKPFCLLMLFLLIAPLASLCFAENTIIEPNIEQSEEISITMNKHSYFLGDIMNISIVNNMFKNPMIMNIFNQDGIIEHTCPVESGKNILIEINEAFSIGDHQIQVSGKEGVTSAWFTVLSKENMVKTSLPFMITHKNMIVEYDLFTLKARGISNKYLDQSWLQVDFNTQNYIDKFGLSGSFYKNGQFLYGKLTNGKDTMDIYLILFWRGIEIIINSSFPEKTVFEMNMKSDRTLYNNALTFQTTNGLTLDYSDLEETKADFTVTNDKITVNCREKETIDPVLFFSGFETHDYSEFFGSPSANSTGVYHGVILSNSTYPAKRGNYSDVGKFTATAKTAYALNSFASYFSFAIANTRWYTRFVTALPTDTKTIDLGGVFVAGSKMGFIGILNTGGVYTWRCQAFNTTLGNYQIATANGSAPAITLYQWYCIEIQAQCYYNTPLLRWQTKYTWWIDNAAVYYMDVYQNIQTFNSFRYGVTAETCTNTVAVQTDCCVLANTKIGLVSEEMDGYQPIARFVYNNSTKLYVGTNILFDGATSTDKDGSVSAYAWNFGDGDTDTGQTATHYYSSTGLFLVNLTIADNQGLQNSWWQNVTIIENVTYHNPIARFNATLSCLVNTSVYLDGSLSRDPDGTITDYSWDFDDGNVTTGSDYVYHTWTSLGLYNVSLTVEDNSTATDVFWFCINVTAPSGGPPSVVDPVAVFNGTYIIYSNQTYTLNASMAIDPDGGALVGYSWDFGDGNVTAGAYPTITHSWLANGNYTVSLTVEDDESATNTYFLSLQAITAGAVTGMQWYVWLLIGFSIALAVGLVLYTKK